MTDYTILWNGYRVGDRLLEDVMFQVTITEAEDKSAEVTSVQIDPSDANYFSKLNADHWYSEIKQDVQSTMDGIANSEGAPVGVVVRQWYEEDDIDLGYLHKEYAVDKSTEYNPYLAIHEY